jgi:hypothetical protein
MASRPETSITRIRTMSSSVIGILGSEQGCDSDERLRRSAACIAGLRHAVTLFSRRNASNIGTKPPDCPETDN